MADHVSLVQKRVQSLEVLPALSRTAVRLLELARQQDADLSEYVKVIETDPSLSAKLLAFANSPFFGIRCKVHCVRQAVMLLGMTQARCVAISHCLAGLHQDWRLDPADASACWEASLCKAVACRRLAKLVDAERAEEMFLCGLLQDVGVSLFFSVAGAEYAQFLQRPEGTIAEQLSYERKLFGLDHAECGGLIARKLGLPELFGAVAAGHHDEMALGQLFSQGRLAVLMPLASLLPHDLRCWRPADVQSLNALLADRMPGRWTDAGAFGQSIQEEFAQLVSALGARAAEPVSLAELAERAAMENARLVGAVVGLAHAQAAQNRELESMVNRLEARNQDAERRADHDPLTGLMNRAGFLRCAQASMSRAKAYGHPVGIAYFDLDRFKEINDLHGHGCGDALLKVVASRLQSGARDSDLLCRWGGDEIVGLITNVNQADCVNVVHRMQQAVEQDPVLWEGLSLRVAMSGGIRWLDRVDEGTDLVSLISEADAALYTAKMRQRGTLCYSMLRNEPPEGVPVRDPSLVFAGASGPHGVHTGRPRAVLDGQSA